MKLFWRALCLCVLALPTSLASAASYYVHIPGINGEQSVPGFVNAMNVKSLTIAPQSFSMVKAIDGASPQLFLAVAQGNPLSATALAYDGAPSPAPDGLIPFPTVLASSYQALGNGIDEEVGFSATNPGSLYLELPGIVGEQTTPGHPGVMKLNSVKLTANDFTIVKPTDGASPALFQAVVQGNNFPQARVLFYDAANPVGPPQQIFNFSTILVSSYQNIGGIPVPLEQVTFSFAHIPEPASATILIMGVGLIVGRRSRLALRAR